MFTGIIQATGEVRAVDEVGGDARLRIGVGDLNLERVSRGDSIAVSGVCLTVVEFTQDEFAADVSQETLSLTTLGALEVGSGQPGTVADARDAAGRPPGFRPCRRRRPALSLQPDARSTRMEFAVPAELGRYVARKGSITIDGTSLTVNDVAGDAFSVNIVPHTLERTIMGGYEPGTRVNLEVDLVARYLERLIAE